MRDDDVKEWKKLINPDDIDKATRYIDEHLCSFCAHLFYTLFDLHKG
jgi:hypothetical protein